MSHIDILFLGDIVGSSGRLAIASHLPALRSERKFDLIIANAENSAHGFGLTPKIADELFGMGIDVLTGGNHTFDKKDVRLLFEQYPDRVLRPMNYPQTNPGRGISVVQTKSGHPFGIMNVMGRVFMDSLDCPFQAFQREHPALRQKTPMILVDIHAETTSEKAAMGWFADGKVSAVVGTHTHVQTADERILPKGTGFLSDAGMNGPYDSIIGIKTEIILERFVKKIGPKMEVAEGPGVFQGVIFSIDPQSGRCLKIERIRKTP